MRRNASMIQREVEKNERKEERKTQRSEKEEILGDSSMDLETLIDLEAQRAGCYVSAAHREGAAMGLLWLMRALRLLEETLKKLICFKLCFSGSLQENSESLPLNRCILMAYESTLKVHHNWLTRNVIQAAIMAAPSRSTFLSKLCPEATEASSESKIEEFLKVYSPILGKVHSYLLAKGLEST